MRATLHPDGGYTVQVSRRDVDTFRRSWPACNLPCKPLRFDYDSTGHLIDTTICAKFDGAAALALSHDAQAYAIRRFDLPDWHKRS